MGDGDKGNQFGFGTGGPSTKDSAPRARNRTVMLTPELTGQMRARFSDDPTAGNEAGSGQPAGFTAPADEMFAAPVASPPQSEAPSPREQSPAIAQFKPMEDPSLQSGSYFEPPWTDEGSSSTFELATDRSSSGGAAFKSAVVDSSESGQSDTRREQYSASGSQSASSDYTPAQAVFSAPTPTPLKEEMPLEPIRQVAPQPEPIALKRTTPTTKQAAPLAKPVVSRHHEDPVQEAEATGDAIIWVKETPIVGFFVSFDNHKNGEFFVLRSGRLIITSDRSATSRSNSMFLIQDDSVSPNHAIMKVSQSGAIEILDQLSDTGTRILRFGDDHEIELSGEKSTIGHGDTIRLGDRTFHLCVLAL